MEKGFRSGGIPNMHQFHVLQLPCGDKTVLRENLHLRTKPSDQDKHTLRGKPSHLKRTLWTSHYEKDEQSIVWGFFVWKYNIFIELLWHTHVFAQPFFNPPSLKLNPQQTNY